MTPDQTKCEIGEVKRYRMHTPDGFAGAMADFVPAADYDALRTSLAKAKASEAKAHELRNQIAAENKRLFAANLRMRECVSDAHTEFCYLMQRFNLPREDRERWRALFNQCAAALTETPND